MSVSKPTARSPISRQGTKTGRFDSRRPNVSQPPRSSSHSGGSYYNTTPTTTYYEDNSGGYGSNDNCGSDSGSSDSGSCSAE